MSKPSLRSPLAVTRLTPALPTGSLSQAAHPSDQATSVLSTAGLSQARPTESYPAGDEKFTTLTVLLVYRFRRWDQASHYHQGFIL